MSFFNKAFDAVGGALNIVGQGLNNITGVSSSSKQAYKQTAALQNLSYQQQKEFAQNAHQWEMQDYANAGLNPALATQASSAGAIASGGSTGGQGSTGNVAGTPIEFIQALNTTSATQHQNELNDQQANLFGTQAMQIIKNLPIDIKTKEEMIEKIRAEIGLIKQQEKTSRAQRQEHYANAKYQNERARGFYESETTGYESGFSFFGSGSHGSNTKTNARGY